MSFSFSFSGDDIDEGEHADAGNSSKPAESQAPAAETATTTRSSAFPVAGKPLLPATHHDLQQMLSELPSQIAFSTLHVELDDGEVIQLPRRELWDVRAQLMAEEDASGEAEAGLGSHDVKTGVYEGGFKSWESSVDLVKVLAHSKSFLASQDEAPCVIELGCGTGLPSLAIFQWASVVRRASDSPPLSLFLADYNPTVLQLVTLPNLIIAWALQQQQAESSGVLADALSPEGELELSPEVIQAFRDFLNASGITLNFFSGAWSPEFVELIESARAASSPHALKQRTVVLGAETIYSPFALQSFTSTVLSFMERRRELTEVYAAAKRLYFGVGGSLDDFVTGARALGAVVEQLREETEGVRRGVVKCYLNP
ncbi:hypothetical protein BX600DRAFT_507998 [Xylariales sp. PMI_506]|nr:hypothetical protein BX600DRAFT_507998 [Xylariales sp. PMI_506]